MGASLSHVYSSDIPFRTLVAVGPCFILTLGPINPLRGPGCKIPLLPCTSDPAVEVDRDKGEICKTKDLGFREGKEMCFSPLISPKDCTPLSTLNQVKINREENGKYYG